MTATALRPDTSTSLAWEFERPVPAGLVVGIDGSPASLAGMSAASVIGRKLGCAVHIVSVLPPFESYPLESDGQSGYDDLRRARLQLRESAVRKLLQAAQAGSDWTFEVVTGRPARMIVSIAERRGADLIIVGRTEHGVMDRILGGETTLQIMRMSAIPVLAVPRECDRYRSAVAAMDFSPGSIRAAKCALEMLDGSGTLYLVHVEPPTELFPAGFSFDESRFPGDMVVWFRRLVEDLEAPPGVMIEPVILNGKPVQTTLEFAERVGADLITAGSHGHTRMERFLLGSVSTGLVRNAQLQVLVAPAGE